MFCGNCGAQVNDNDRFCTVCGTQRQQVQTENAQAPVNNNANGQQIPYVAPTQPAYAYGMGASDPTVIPKAIGAIFSILFAITPFLPFVGLWGFTISALEYYTEFDAANMLVLTLLVVLGGLLSLLASIRGGGVLVIIVGVVGFLYFLFRLIISMTEYGGDFLKIYGVGFYGIGVCSIALIICGAAIHNAKLKK